MATLQGNKVQDTYKDLLQVSNSNSGVDSTLRDVEDGEGTVSNLKVSTTTVSAGNLKAGMLNANGATIHGNLSATSSIAGYYLSGAGMAIQNPGSQCSLEIGQGQSSNQYAYIDLVGDTTYTDFGLRIIRGNSGPNTDSSIQHRGIGALSINAVDVASVKLKTNNQDRLIVKSDGKVGIGTDTPNHELTVVGDISATGTIHGGSSHGDWVFLSSPVSLTFDPGNGITRVQGATDEGKIVGSANNNIAHRFVPIAGYHGVPSNAKYVMLHVYVGQADFYGVDPHSGVAQWRSIEPHLNGGNNSNAKANISLGIGSVPFPRFATSSGAPTLAEAVSTALSLNGDSNPTVGNSEVYWPANEDAAGMSPSNSICFRVVDQNSDGYSVLHTLKILAYKL